jgi:hypothetical protein
MTDIDCPVVTTIRHGPTYREWCSTEGWDGTNFENAAYFVKHHLTPWIESFGYIWRHSDEMITRLFSQFAYAMTDVDLENRMTGRNFRLGLPAVQHRNLPEDRQTYELFVGLDDFAEFLDEVKMDYQVLESSSSHLLYDFCYLYVDVTSGTPGRFTQKALDADVDTDEEDSGKGIANTNLPDAYANRRKNDLY